ncbi:MAG: hypothetical protein WC619_04895 [Patescibacteria group bacterium]
MCQQTSGNSDAVVTGDDSAVVSEADVAGVGNNGGGTGTQPVPRWWVDQYLHQPGLGPEQIRARKDQLRTDYGIEVE